MKTFLPWMWCVVVLNCEGCKRDNHKEHTPMPDRKSTTTKPTFPALTTYITSNSAPKSTLQPPTTYSENGPYTTQGRQVAAYTTYSEDGSYRPPQDRQVADSDLGMRYIYIICGVIGALVLLGLVLLAVLLSRRRNSRQKSFTINSKAPKADDISPDYQDALTVRYESSKKVRPTNNLAPGGSPLLTGKRIGPYENVVIENTRPIGSAGQSAIYTYAEECENTDNDIRATAEMYSQVGEYKAKHTDRLSACDSTEMVDNVLYD